MREIFLSLLLFIMEFQLFLLSFNPILNCFVQCTILCFIFFFQSFISKDTQPYYTTFHWIISIYKLPKRCKILFFFSR